MIYADNLKWVLFENEIKFWICTLCYEKVCDYVMTYFAMSVKNFLTQ